MKRWICFAAVVLVMGSAVQAATEAQKQAAIDSGLVYLRSIQQADGHFEAGDVYYDTSATGAALLAFMEEGYSAGTNVVINGTDYGDVVGNGLNYLFSQATTYAIGGQPAGNPDTLPNGIGVKFVTSGNNGRDTYVTGLAGIAVAKAAAATPNALVSSGSQAGRTYKDVVQDVVDYFAYGQNDSGSGRGGWRYYANYGTSDNSTAQWPAIAMLYADVVSGVTIPQFVKDELRIWTDYIQNDWPGSDPRDGGSNYYYKNDASWGSNVSRTGGWLAEAAFVGTDAALVTNADVTAALAYLNSQWQTYASGWNGNFGHPYAMWATYKGLELTIGLGDTTTITNTRAFNAATMEIDAGDTWNWFEDYCEYLYDTRNTGGYWSGYSSWNAPLATAWNINILNATQIPGGEVPVPGAILLGGIGLAISSWRLRRRRIG